MVFRVARHTNNIEALSEFYTKVLNLQVLGEFKDHDHYDGIFIGLEAENWHLEFTKSNEIADHKFDEDDLFVFYPETEMDKILANIEKYGINKHIPKNPYWQVNGIQINNPDGHGIIISGLRIK
ncbi:MAG TPA: VOC family protein [Bacteroidia bacterium]